MDIFKIASKNRIVILGICTYSIISLFLIFYNHHYYDDEIFNIRLISLSLRELFFEVQYGVDVHPPLSYLINKAIYEMFSSYKAILFFSILINAAALSYFYSYAEKILGDIYSKLLLFIFVFINSGVLLWGNSIRWRAYWIPAFIILYTYLLKHQKLTTRNLIVIGLILSFMTYISYLTFLVIIAFLMLLLISRRDDISIKNILVISFVYFSLTSYQLYIFITEHLGSKEEQVFSIIYSIPNTIYGVLNGGSVFLTDPVFLLFSVFTLIIIVFGLKTLIVNYKTTNPVFIQSIILVAGLLTLMIITGVGGKYRNSVSLSIPFYFIISYFLVSIKNINIKRVYISTGLVLSIISVCNLVTHQNTAKNSYNMPISQLSILLDNPTNKFIITYDPVTYFYLKEQNYDVRYLLDKHFERTIKNGTSIYLIKTYQGSFNHKLYKNAMRLYRNTENCMKNINREEMGSDKYYKIKNKLRGKKSEIPQFQIYITHGEVEGECVIPYWDEKIK